MKSLFGCLLRAALWVISLLLSLATLASAYSESLPPAEHPMLSLLGLAFPVVAVALLALLVLLLIARQYRLAVLPFLIFVLCFGQLRAYCPINLFPTGATGDTLHLLSFNVMSLPADTDAHGRNRVLSYLADCGADIVCLQEFNTETGGVSRRAAHQALAAVYPYSDVTAVGRSGTNHVACYSRHPIVGSRRIESSGNYNGSAVYQILWRGDTLTVINNHLESNKLTDADKALYKDMWLDPEREKVETGARALLPKLAEAAAIRSAQVDSVAAVIDRVRPRSLIVCGDLNDSPISYAHHVIARHLDDAFTRVGNGPGFTYHRGGLFFRIDHIFAGPDLHPVSCRVDRTIDVSDHYPIRATFVVKEQITDNK